MCKQCETKPVYEFTNKRQVCKTCFIRWFEKKFLYTIRKFEMIKHRDMVYYKSGKDFRKIVLNELMKILGGRVGRTKNGKYNKLVLGDTTDIIAKEILKNTLRGKLNLKELKPNYKKTIRPMYLFLDKEVLLYARLKKLKFNKVENKKETLDVFIEGLEKKHPELKHSIVNSYLKIE